MTKRAFDFCTWLILPTVYAEYVRSDQLAQVWASNSQHNFENTTEEVQKRRSGGDLIESFSNQKLFFDAPFVIQRCDKHRGSTTRYSFGTEKLKPSSKTTVNHLESSSEDEKWPNRKVDGMYGIGSQAGLLDENLTVIGPNNGITKFREIRPNRKKKNF